MVSQEARSYKLLKKTTKESILSFDDGGKIRLWYEADGIVL